MTAQQIAKTEGFYWGDEVKVAYFDAAERDMTVHWDRIIWPVLGQYPIDFRNVLELAAGHGRNSAKLATFAEKITLVDINPENILFCQERFKGDARFRFVQNDGASLADIDDNSISFFYSFDSMVHFDVEIVLSYIKEVSRVLEPNGLGFFHYSNYTGGLGAKFTSNPHWRNFMSKDLFNHMAIRSGLKIAYSSTSPWGGIEHLDAVSLVQKPL